MKTRLLIIFGIMVLTAGLSASVLFDDDIFSENNTVMKSDAELLDEINKQAVISYKNDDKEETDREH